MNIKKSKNKTLTANQYAQFLFIQHGIDYEAILWPELVQWNQKNINPPHKEEALMLIFSEELEKYKKKKKNEEKSKDEKGEIRPLNTLLKEESRIEKIPLTGVVNGKFYHTVFIPDKTEYRPFVLFEDGANFPVVHQKEGKNRYIYSFICIDDQHLIFRTNEPLWYSEGTTNTINKEGVQMVINKESLEANELHELVNAKLVEYYDFYNKEEVSIVFAHIVHTYILGLLGKTFYLLLEGEKNTGKSSLQAVMAQLQHHGSFSGKITMPLLVRKVHFLGATVNLDELDKLHKDEKQVAMGILNSGMYENGTYEIVNMDSKSSQQKMKVFYTFSAKTFSANHSFFPDSFISRCIVINTIRNKKSVKSLHGCPKAELMTFQAIRNKLFAYCLINGKKIKKDIELVKTELESSSQYGRRCDVFSIIGGVLKHFNCDYKIVLKYLRERDLVNEEDLTDNRYYFALRFLVEKMGKCVQSQLLEFTNEELKDYIIECLDMDDYSKFKPTSRSIGSLLRKHRIISKPSNSERITSGANKGKFKYKVEIVHILEIIDRSQHEDLKESIRKINFNIPN